MPLVRNTGKSFSQASADFNKFRRQIPAKVGTMAVNFFKESFIKQGWDDDGFKQWKERKPTARRNKGRAILVDSGRLRRSIRMVSADLRRVIVATDVPYAKAHNEGFRGSVTIPAHERRVMGNVKVYSIKTRKAKLTKTETGISIVRSHSRNMNIPERRFMGNSKTLNGHIGYLMLKELSNALNS